MSSLFGEFELIWPIAGTAIGEFVTTVMDKSIVQRKGAKS